MSESDQISEKIPDAGLRQLVREQIDMPEPLPLVHTTRCELLDGIAQRGNLTPTMCPVYKENLVYFFYGRPAYRASKVPDGAGLDVMCPVCFVFKHDVLFRSTKRIVPCDSGAVATNRFAPDLEPKDLSGLELDPTIESAQGVVRLFFEDNEQYFRGRAIADRKFVPDSLAERFYRLVCQRRNSAHDDRKSAIEFQSESEIALRDQLLFVVLPYEFLEDPKIRKCILVDWRCDAVGYDTVDGDSPLSYYSLVREVVRRRLEEARRI